MALRVIGVRHGEVHNPGGVVYSSLPGFVLSERGHAEAAEVAEALRSVPVEAIYASPLDRAVQTATAIADATGTSFTTDERLAEWRYWETWAGRHWDEFAADPVAVAAFRDDPGSLSDVESLAELAARMTAVLDEIEAAHTDGLVVVVSHLEPLRAVLLAALGRPPVDLHDVLIGHCGVVRLRPGPALEPIPVGSLGALLEA